MCKECVCIHALPLFATGVSIPVDGGGLLTSWFNTDLQPRIAENGEDVVFPSDHTSNGMTDGGKQ